MHKYLVVSSMLAGTLAAMFVGARALAAPVKWVDANGNVHYGEQAPKGVASSAVRVQAQGQGDEDPRLKDVAAVPYLNERGRAAYQEFLAHPGPRAFVTCTDGTSGTAYGETEYAMQDALSKLLAQNKSHGCKPYAVNSSVVW